MSKPNAKSTSLANLRPTGRGNAGAAVLGTSLLCLALVGGTPVSASPTSGATIDRAKVQQRLQRHVFHAADGRTLSLDQFKGEVVVLSFWASWCKPCQKELPSLDALQVELAPKGGRVMAISIDSEPRSAERFAKMHSIRMPIYPDGPDGLARELDLPHIPYTIIVDRSGEVVYTSGGGAVGSLTELSAVARKLAASPQLASQTAGGNAP